MPRPLMLLVLYLGACGTSSNDPDAATSTVDAGEVGQGSEAQATLVINEVAPRGEGSDWVELFNRGDSAVDLCSYFLTDSPDRLDHYLPLGGTMPPAACPPRLLQPGSYAVVQLDGTPIVEGAAIDPSHAPFRLGVADEIHLLTTAGARIDGLMFLFPSGPHQPARTTLARSPNGTGLFFERPPTAGEPNPVTR